MQGLKGRAALAQQLVGLRVGLGVAGVQWITARQHGKAHVAEDIAHMGAQIQDRVPVFEPGQQPIVEAHHHVGHVEHLLELGRHVVAHPFPGQSAHFGIIGHRGESVFRHIADVVGLLGDVVEELRRGVVVPGFEQGATDGVERILNEPGFLVLLVGQRHLFLEAAMKLLRHAVHHGLLLGGQARRLAQFLTRHSRQCGAIGIGHPGVLTQRADVIGCQFAVIGGTGVLRGQNLVFDDLLVGGVHVRLRLVFPVRALRARIGPVHQGELAGLVLAGLVHDVETCSALGDQAFQAHLEGAGDEALFEVHIVLVILRQTFGHVLESFQLQGAIAHAAHAVLPPGTLQRQRHGALLGREVVHRHAAVDLGVHRQIHLPAHIGRFELLGLRPGHDVQQLRLALQGALGHVQRLFLAERLRRAHLAQFGQHIRRHGGVRHHLTHRFLPCTACLRLQRLTGGLPLLHVLNGRAGGVLEPFQRLAHHPVQHLFHGRVALGARVAHHGLQNAVQPLLDGLVEVIPVRIRHPAQQRVVRPRKILRRRRRRDGPRCGVRVRATLGGGSERIFTESGLGID